jgi:hypothetical protein
LVAAITRCGEAAAWIDTGGKVINELRITTLLVS